MGRPKEWLPIADTTMLARQVETLRSCAQPVVVVARDADQQLPELPAGCDVVLDDPPDAGPLAAIASGLQHLVDRHGFADADAAFVTACDLPFVTARDVAWLRGLLGDADVVMPEAEGRLQPMAAVVRAAALRHARALLAAGTRTPRSLAQTQNAVVLPEAAVRAHDPQLRFLRNLNAPEDLERWRDDMG